MPAPIRLHATAFTHQGAVRAHNEDTVAVGRWIMSEPMAAPAVLEHTIAAPLICLVADGMGGHAAGEVASRAVADHLTRRAGEAVDEAAIGRLLLEANDELFALMAERPAWSGRGAGSDQVTVRASAARIASSSRSATTPTKSPLRTTALTMSAVKIRNARPHRRFLRAFTTGATIPFTG